MAVEADGAAKGCTFLLEIKNISQCWWLKKTESIDSPTLLAEALEGTNWTVSLFPLGYTDEENVGILLKREKSSEGPDVVEVNYSIAFLAKDGSILKCQSAAKTSFKEAENRGFPQFVAREKVFFSERDSYLHDDTLIVQVNMWQKEFPANPKILFNRTVFNINRRYLLWNIEDTSTLKSETRKNIEDKLIKLDLVLSKDIANLDVEMKSCDEDVKYISCKTSIIDSSGKRENCGVKIILTHDLKPVPALPPLLLWKYIDNKNQYLPNDTLSLDFELIFGTIEHFDSTVSSTFENEPVVMEHVGKKICPHGTYLIEDLDSIRKNGFACDVELRSKTKNFPAHKLILIARSQVFRTLFSADKNCKYVDIKNFNEETLGRMLLYMYTDKVEDLQIQIALELYKIAHLYQIVSLKRKCSSFLIVNLCPTNACEILQLANHHSDEDFIHFVRHYMISLPESFFASSEWGEFMKTDLKIAAEIMLKKIHLGASAMKSQSLVS